MQFQCLTGRYYIWYHPSVHLPFCYHFHNWTVLRPLAHLISKFQNILCLPMHRDKDSSKMTALREVGCVSTLGHFHNMSTLGSIERIVKMCLLQASLLSFSWWDVKDTEFQWRLLLRGLRDFVPPIWIKTAPLCFNILVVIMMGLIIIIIIQCLYMLSDQLMLWLNNYPIIDLRHSIIS